MSFDPEISFVIINSKRRVEVYNQRGERMPEQEGLYWEIVTKIAQCASCDVIFACRDKHGTNVLMKRGEWLNIDQKGAVSPLTQPLVA